jgi:hypothetical protein
MAQMYVGLSAMMSCPADMLRLATKPVPLFGIFLLSQHGSGETGTSLSQHGQDAACAILARSLLTKTVDGLADAGGKTPMYGPTLVLVSESMMSGDSCTIRVPSAISGLDMLRQDRMGYEMS